MNDAKINWTAMQQELAGLLGQDVATPADIVHPDISFIEASLGTSLWKTPNSDHSEMF
jgi:hypothetical protein